MGFVFIDRKFWREIEISKNLFREWIFFSKRIQFVLFVNKPISQLMKINSWEKEFFLGDFEERNSLNSKFLFVWEIFAFLGKLILSLKSEEYWIGFSRSNKEQTINWIKYRFGNLLPKIIGKKGKSLMLKFILQIHVPFWTTNLSPSLNQFFSSFQWNFLFFQISIHP